MAAKLSEILNSHHTHRPIIAGVLNVTPDSFSDGGEFFQPRVATEHARRMADDGADIIDIGAESTRPGSQRVGAEEQIARLRDVLPAIVGFGPAVSIDTTLAAVARFAMDAGATIINDVSAGRDDAEMLPLAAARQCPIVLMHMLGQPKTMQEAPVYRDVVSEVREFLRARIEAAVATGVRRECIIVDPGIGFGKRLEHNLALLAGVGKLAELGCPVMVGPSRKRFIGDLTGQGEPSRRVIGTVAACLEAWRRGATAFRVHDVAEVVGAFKVAQAIAQG